MGSPRAELAGQIFGRLIVVERAPRNPRHHDREWLCQCTCGARVVVTGANLRTGRTASCGCLRREVTAARSTTHDKSHSAEFGVWHGMKQRCSYTRHISYRFYGARGIRVCERWRRSFSAFYADMGPRPAADYSIERSDNDGHYEPGNCRWARAREQADNRRRSRHLTFQGDTLSVAAWTRRRGWPRTTIYDRLADGWPVPRALTEPVRHR